MNSTSPEPETFYTLEVWRKTGEEGLALYPLYIFKFNTKEELLAFDHMEHAEWGYAWRKSVRQWDDKGDLVYHEDHGAGNFEA